MIYPIEVWINGSSVESSGIEVVAGTGDEVQYFDLTPFAPLFNPGHSNVIAVVVNNVWQPSWDNVAFDLSLRALPQSSSHESPRTFSTWAKRFLGNANALLSGNGDGDLLSNLSEFATGSDPTVVSSDPWPEGEVVLGESLDYPFGFKRLRGGAEITPGHYEVGNLTYLIEISPSLGELADWQTLMGTQAVSSTPVDLGEGMERVDYRLTAEVMDNGRYFVRQRTLLEQLP